MKFSESGAKPGIYGFFGEELHGDSPGSHEEDEGGIYQISFSPNGGSRGGEIILADKKERMYRITVNRITGVVTIAEEES